MKNFKVKITNEIGLNLEFEELFLSYTHAMAFAENAIELHAQFKGNVESILIKQIK